MAHTTIKTLFKNQESYDQEEITVKGWVKTIRASKKFGFIEINDGTHFNNFQVVYDNAIENFEGISKYQVGSAIEATGTFVLTPDSKQPFEMQAKAVSLLGSSDNTYPLQKKRHTFEFLRTMPHLRARTNTFSAVFRVRSIIAQGVHEFFANRDFIYVNTPIITTSDAEGAGEMFRVTTLDLDHLPRTEDQQINFEEDFFAKPTNLTVSGQLEGEAYALAFQKIYTFGPTFRAENSNTARHAAEFWMIEPEIAFADLNDNMDLAEDLFKYLIDKVLKEAPYEMEFFNKFVDKGLIARLADIKSKEFERITYTKAIELLQGAKKEFEYQPVWGSDLQTEHERYLTEEIFKKPVFVTDYPKEIKAFYMRINDDQKTVAAVDLLVPKVGEIIGGSQREEREDVLRSRMEAMDLDTDAYQWYLDLRRFGGVKHAGFGLGFERAIMYLTGMTNIRDVISYPRTVNNI